MIYAGPPVRGDSVELSAVTAAELGRVAVDETARPALTWHRRSAADDASLYFGIRERGRLVGQIFLHDIDDAAAEALVGYHVFAATDRGRGIGTEALRLILRHPEFTPAIRSLVIITSADNLGSQRVAERCGFERDGAPREDAGGVRYRYRRSPRG